MWIGQVHAELFQTYDRREVINAILYDSAETEDHSLENLHADLSPIELTPAIILSESFFK